MNSITLIRKLSERGAEQLFSVLGWINPIPQTGEQVVNKLTIAKQRLQYDIDRQGSTDCQHSEIAVIDQLLEEITSIIAKSIQP
ncbi:hypothetical protein [Celerinatantimonas sp. MCCC 1A17872]|uniref:hypothetical protein n=1 Tax=Celerinatantimonas sp. MCCC 1A17872 TaxID=3177514 RepID=UPI0038C3434E